MSEQVYLDGMDSERRDLALSQWFTPPKLAERIVQFAAMEGLWRSKLFTRSLRVLEPSCGHGALIKPLCDVSADIDLVGVDIDPRNVAVCESRDWGLHSQRFICANFLTHDFKGERFDVVLMNCPFEDGQTEAHILRALEWSDVVIAHCPLTTLAGVDRGGNLWGKHELRRMAVCSSRPKYGEKGGQTDMVTFGIEKGSGSRNRDAVHDVRVEFWT